MAHDATELQSRRVYGLEESTKYPHLLPAAELVFFFIADLSLPSRRR